MKIASPFHELLAITPIPCSIKVLDPGKIFGDSHDEDEKYDNEHAAEVVALCAECPIQWECLSYAITHNEQYGVWGGTTPAQRDLMRRRGRR